MAEFVCFYCRCLFAQFAGAEKVKPLVLTPLPVFFVPPEFLIQLLSVVTHLRLNSNCFRPWAYLRCRVLYRAVTLMPAAELRTFQTPSFFWEIRMPVNLLNCAFKELGGILFDKLTTQFQLRRFSLLKGYIFMYLHPFLSFKKSESGWTEKNRTRQDHQIERNKRTQTKGIT